MQLYIVWKIGISGWSKEVVAIFVNKENALKYIERLQSNSQYYYEINDRKTDD